MVNIDSRGNQMMAVRAGRMVAALGAVVAVMAVAAVCGFAAPAADANEMYVAPGQPSVVSATTSLTWRFEYLNDVDTEFAICYAVAEEGVSIAGWVASDPEEPDSGCGPVHQVHAYQVNDGESSDTVSGLTPGHTYTVYARDYYLDEAIDTWVYDSFETVSWSVYIDPEGSAGGGSSGSGGGSGGGGGSGSKAAAEGKAKGEAEAKAKIEGEAKVKAEAEAKAKAEAEAKATIALSKERVTATSVVVKVVTTEPGTVTISGPGLKRTVTNLSAGVNHVVVKLSATGKAMRRAGKRIKISVSLHLPSRTVVGSRSVKL